MTEKRLVIGKDGFSLPLDSVTQTFAILAKRGVGKTYTAGVMVEEMVAAGLRVVVLDPLGVWWGLRASADGKREGLPVVVLGGEHGDLPLAEGAGEIVADLIVDQVISCVIDLSLFRKGEQRRFVTDFAERLYQRNRDPLHVMLDEADSFAPQRPMKGQERMLGAIEDVVRRGRARGLGVTLVTQRSAVLNKDVLNMAEVLVAMRTLAPSDREAVDAWVKVHGEPERRQQLMSSLASLPIGSAWFWSPGWLDVFQLVAIREKRTFDSSATPKVGQRMAQPKRLAPVELKALEKKLASVIEQAKANDPRELRREISRLNVELRQAGRPNVATVAIVQFDEVRRELALAKDKARVAEDGLRQLVTEVREFIGSARNVVDRLQAGIERLENGKTARGSAKAERRPYKPEVAGSRPAAPISEPIVLTDTPPLKAGARRMLEELASRHPTVWTRSQLGLLTGFAPRGGTFSGYLSALKVRGFISTAGAEVAITEAGLAAAGTVPAAPASHEDVMAMWRKNLKAGCYRMLEVALERGPISREELGEAAGFAASGGTFAGYLSVLRRNALIEEQDGQITAASVLLPSHV